MLPPLEGDYLDEKAPQSNKGPVVHLEVVDLVAVRAVICFRAFVAAVSYVGFEDAI